jgi:hypothetical protein
VGDLLQQVRGVVVLFVRLGTVAVALNLLPLEARVTHHYTFG